MNKLLESVMELFVDSHAFHGIPNGIESPIFRGQPPTVINKQAQKKRKRQVEEVGDDDDE